MALSMQLRLAGKVALITGAAHGIGRETALTFAAEGASVLATDIDEQGLQELRSLASTIETRRLDVTDRQAVEVVACERAFNVVFNCAGWVHQGSILECNEEDWQRSFRVNLDSMYYVCHTVIPAMISNGGGSIINMSSVVSSVKGAASRFAYGASKAAVIGLTKSIAADYVAQKIRANVVCPGTVNTPSLGVRVASLPGEPDANWRRFIGRQPMGRLGDAREIAALVVYLASDESAFTTGAIHVVDGGWSM
jgi:2-keto-3-deoxy-L-fuconate dehydrogenase